MSISAQIRIRRDTAANFTSADPTLALGEIAYEVDTKRFKVGTGSTVWTALGYAAQNPTDLTVAGTVGVAGVMSVTNATASTLSTNGALVVTGGTGIGGALNVAGAAGLAGITTVSNSTASSTSANGALVVTGGVGVGGALNVSGGMTATPNSSAPTSNVAIGPTAGAAMQSGAADNVCIGSAAGDAITTGDFNVAVGVNALGSMGSNNSAIAIGRDALLLNTASSSVAIGALALDANTTQIGNSAVGASALGALSSGTHTTAIGSEAGRDSTSSSYSVFVGSQAGRTSTGTDGTVVVGAFSASGVTGNANVVIGSGAAAGLSTGNSNVVIGSQNPNVGNGPAPTIGNAYHNVIIGANTDVASSTEQESILIGSNFGPRIISDGSRTTKIGGPSTTQARLHGGTFLSTGANMQSTMLGQSTELLSGLTGPTVTSTNRIPANSIVLGVTAGVTTEITGATSFDIGDGVTADLFGDDVGVALNTTSNKVIAPTVYAAATNVVLTANGSDFTAGAVRITVHYITLVAPTS